jgi:hypothetical protein
MKAWHSFLNSRNSSLTSDWIQKKKFIVILNCMWHIPISDCFVKHGWSQESSSETIMSIPSNNVTSRSVNSDFELLVLIMTYPNWSKSVDGMEPVPWIVLRLDVALIRSYSSIRDQDLPISVASEVFGLCRLWISQTRGLESFPAYGLYFWNVNFERTENPGLTVSQAGFKEIL